MLDKIILGAKMLPIVALLSACMADLAELEASLAELEGSLNGLNQSLNANAPRAQRASQRSVTSSDPYTNAMSRARRCGSQNPLSCRLPALEAAQRTASRSNNVPRYITASKALIRANDQAGRPGIAKWVAADANKRAPSEPYFATYLRARGQTPLNSDGSKNGRKCSDVWFNTCALTDNPVTTAVVVGAALAGAKVIGNACSGGACASSTVSPETKSSTRDVNARPANTSGSTRGVRRIEPWGRSPDGSSPQYKVTCTTRLSERYWQQGGQWYSGTGFGGAIGRKGWKIEQLAENHCG